MGTQRPTPLDHLSAEAEADPNAPVTVLLDGVPVDVLPLRKWKASAIRALRAGDFDLWAERALAGDGYVRVWQAIDPDVDQVETFFAQWSELTGQDTGKSRASLR